MRRAAATTGIITGRKSPLTPCTMPPIRLQPTEEVIRSTRRLPSTIFVRRHEESKSKSKRPRSPAFLGAAATHPARVNDRTTNTDTTAKCKNQLAGAPRRPGKTECNGCRTSTIRRRHDDLRLQMYVNVTTAERLPTLHHVNRCTTLYYTYIYQKITARSPHHHNTR